MDLSYMGFEHGLYDELDSLKTPGKGKGNNGPNL